MKGILVLLLALSLGVLIGIAFFPEKYFDLSALLQFLLHSKLLDASMLLVNVAALFLAVKSYKDSVKQAKENISSAERIAKREEERARLNLRPLVDLMAVDNFDLATGLMPGGCVANLELNMFNSGLGAAHVTDLQFFYRGKPMDRSCLASELLNQSQLPVVLERLSLFAEVMDVSGFTSRPFFIEAGGKRKIFEVRIRCFDKRTMHQEDIDALELVWGQLKNLFTKELNVSYSSCSVFGDDVERRNF